MTLVSSSNENVLPLVTQSIIDDPTMDSLQRVYGMGVRQIFDSYEGLSLIADGIPAHLAIRTPKSEKEDGNKSAAVGTYQKICNAMQVRPDAAMLVCCSAHDICQWLESIPCETWSVQELCISEETSAFATKEVSDENEKNESEVSEKGTHQTPPTYLQVIERYLFEEDRREALAKALQDEYKRRSGEAEAAQTITTLSFVDQKLLELAEQDSRNTLFEMAAFDIKHNIILPFVSKCKKASTHLDLSLSHLPTNCLMAVLVSLRACFRLVYLSLANLQMDTPFAVLMFLGPLRHHLRHLHTLVLDNNPIGSTAMTVLLRVARLHPALYSVSLLGISCDAAIIRKLNAICEVRKASSTNRLRAQSANDNLIYVEEPRQRKVILNNWWIWYQSSLAQFLIDQHRLR